MNDEPGPGVRAAGGESALDHAANRQGQLLGDAENHTELPAIEMAGNGQHEAIDTEAGGVPDARNVFARKIRTGQSRARRGHHGLVAQSFPEPAADPSRIEPSLAQSLLTDRQRMSIEQREARTSRQQRTVSG